LPPDDKCQGLPGAIYCCTPSGILNSLFPGLIE